MSKRQEQMVIAGTAPESVTGTVTRVTWFDENSGRIIVRVNVDGRAEAWVGTSAPLKEGTPVRGVGVIETHPKYGPQRKCTSIMPVLPVGADAMRAWLAGGALPGIGPVLAEAIVARFGIRTREIFETNPSELQKVAGIGDAKLKGIIDAWAVASAELDLQAFFAERGVSGFIAGRIAKHFGGRAIHIVSTQPYKLALEVSGVGFKIADDIARSVGIGEDAPERAQAGALQVLYDGTNRGDCYLPLKLLMRRTADLLGDNHADIYEAIRDLNTTLRPAGKDKPPATLVVMETVDDEAVVYPRPLYEAEVALAARLTTLLTAKSAPLRGAAESIAAFERDAKVTLAPEQREAVEAAAKHNIVVVTGPPGSGKSTIAKAILAVFDSAKKTCLLASPTGRAAARLSETTGHSAATIHRTLGVRSGPNGRFAGFLHDIAHPLQTDALMVDEAGMMDVNLANSLFDAIEAGTRVVIVGDVDQLPSVGPGAVLRDIITSDAVPTVRLAKIYRQADGSSILDAALAVNAGRMPEGPSLDDTDVGEFFMETACADAEEVSAYAAEQIVDIAARVLPERFGFDPLRDVQVIVPMIKGGCGTVALNHALQDALNPHGETVEVGAYKFRRGDKVINVKNNYDISCFNGDIGTVEELDTANSTAVINFGDGRVIPFTKELLRDCMLAYAISCHRFQGSEAKAVVVGLLPEHTILASRPWTYTALTRGKKVVVLVTVPRTLRGALREVKREMRRTRLAHRLRGGT